MRQAVMVEPGRIEFKEVSKPSPASNQALIQIKRIGVCGSDIHVFHGQHPYTTYPIVQGHEASGTITETGSAVKGLLPGDNVTFMPQVTCGECFPCRNGLYHICETLKVMGFQTGGVAQELVALAEESVLKLPRGVSLDHGAMIEPVAVAVHALQRGGHVKGQKVLVLGAGPIGNLVAQVARASGASAVMITDISDYKVEKARACGLEFAVNTGKEDLDDAISSHFGPDRADLILECVGAQETIDQAVDNARKGTTIVIVGVFGERPLVDIGLVQDRELKLVGTLMYQKADYERAIDLMARGDLSLDPMITHHFGFSDYQEAYEAIEAAKGDIMKVMITLE